MKQHIEETLKQRQKKYYGKVLAVSLCVGAIVLAIVFLQWLIERSYIGFTMILAFPLVVIPLIACAIVATTRICHEPDYNFRTFYSFYVVGLSPQMRTSFRLLVTLLKSLLIMFVINIVGFAIIYYIPTLRDAINEFMAQIDGANIIDTTYRFMDFLTSEPFYTPYMILTNVSFGVSLIYFVYSILSKCLYANCKINAMLPNGRNMPVFKEVFSKYRKVYYQTLLKYNWYYYVVPILGYILSIILSFVFHFELYGTIIGVLVLIILLIPCMPNLLILNDIMYEIMGAELQIKNASFITDILSKFNGDSNLSEEQKREIDKMLNDLSKRKDDVIDGEFKENPHNDSDDKE